MHWWAWLLIGLASYVLPLPFFCDMNMPISLDDPQNQWRWGLLWPVIIVGALGIAIMDWLGIYQSPGLYPHKPKTRLQRFWFKHVRKW